ncbi:MAG TPA: glycosyltransferase 87 family protein [Propionibacteriaceae bacterium]|nr:glycosyltransferase 87 family protein [Propionibacteriaceae bacterium]
MLQVPRLGVRGMAVVLLAVGAVVAVRSAVGSDFVDLSVYEAGGRAVLRGLPLYRATGDNGLPFTYPPFAALLFVPLTLAGPTAPLLMVISSIAALARIAVLLGRELSVAWDLDPFAGTAGLLGLVLMSEPVTASLSFGQVNALVLWLVVEAFAVRRAGAPWLIGLASAIKLTPLAFVPLMGARRPRDGVSSVLAFTLTVALGWWVQPSEAARYWSALVVDAGRVGGISYVGNQSINGMLWRLAGPGGVPWAWALCCLVVGLVCYAVGIRALGRGEWILAAGSVGLFSLLASPISWSHHWVGVTPVLVALCLRRSRVSTLLAFAGVVVLTSRVIWRIPSSSGLHHEHDVWQFLGGNAYVLFGLVVVAHLGWSLRGTDVRQVLRRWARPRAATTRSEPLVGVESAEPAQHGEGLP